MIVSHHTAVSCARCSLDIPSIFSITVRHGVSFVMGFPHNGQHWFCLSHMYIKDFLPFGVSENSITPSSVATAYTRFSVPAASVAGAFCLSVLRTIRFQISFRIDIALFFGNNRRQRKPFARQSAIHRTCKSSVGGCWRATFTPAVRPASGCSSCAGSR